MSDPASPEVERDAVAGEGGGWDELDTLPLDAVRELFVTLGKALRAYQLYDENNPVYQRFVTALADAFRALWTEVERLHVRVTEETLQMGPAEVYRGESRADSLAFLLYKDGIRDVTFLPGIEDEELTRFLSVLQRARNLRPEGDDLLTILWEEDLRHFKYHYVDLLAEGVVLPEPGDGSTREELQNVLEEELEEPESAQAAPASPDDAPKPVSRDDFNPTLYSLDPREMERLRVEIDREMERDLRADVLKALFDRLEEPGHPERQSEILDVLGQLLPNFLSRGALHPAAEVVEYLSELESRSDVLDEERRKQIRQVIDDVSATETMGELVRALEDGSIEPSPEELGRFLTRLRAGALAPLLRAAETTEVRELKPVIQEAVRGIAEKNADYLALLFRHDDPVVVAGAVRLTGKVKVTEAGVALADVMAHPDERVRLAAVEAARELRASAAADALLYALNDPVREVRMAAARGLGELRYTPAADELEEQVTSKELRDADPTEKIAFFEAYGLVAGERAVPVLDRLLNRRGFLGRREPAEIRAAAALALGTIDAGGATEALRRAVDEDDPVVRNAVERALQREAAAR